MSICKSQITSNIAALSDEKKAKWWNNYLKNTIEFIGVGIPDIRKVLFEELPGYPNNEESTNQILSVSNELFEENIAEYKLAAVLIWQYFLLDRKTDKEVVELIKNIFEKKLIFDWNTCDWLCVRVLTPVIDRSDGKIHKEILSWVNKDDLWHSRASIVPFAQSAVLPDVLRSLEGNLVNMIRRKERFAKTSVGWLLREASKRNPSFVKEFYNNNEAYFTAEVRKNAFKYF